MGCASTPSSWVLPKLLREFPPLATPSTRGAPSTRPDEGHTMDAPWDSHLSRDEAGGDGWKILAKTRVKLQ